MTTSYFECKTTLFPSPINTKVVNKPAAPLYLTQTPKSAPTKLQRHKR